jgi:histidinol-phosphatase (PHP family)
MLTGYHNHSLHSDGRAAPETMLAEAARLGMGELGISDHLVLDPHGEPPFWSMEPQRLAHYLDSLDALRSRAGGPRLRIGIELDWLPGRQGAIAEALDDARYDYAIGSVHQVMGLHVDSAPERLQRLGPEAMGRLHEHYWSLVREMAASGLFDIAAHLDLPKKLHPRPSAGLQRGDRADGLAAAHHRAPTPQVGDAPNLGEALDAIAAAGMTVELNTAGWDMPCRECYPSPAILAACHDRGIPVTIGADAHSPVHLLRHYDLALRLLQRIGYTELMRFEARRAIPQALADFAGALDRP